MKKSVVLSMDTCYACKNLFCDHSVGFEECRAMKMFTDAEYDEYCENGRPNNCRFFEEVKDDKS